MLDTIKDYVSPERFSILAHICLIIHFNCGFIFTAITTALRLGEMEMFSCAVNTNFATYKAYVEKTCFSLYQEAYNSPVRFNVFVMFSFGSVIIVTIIYSLAVGSRIDETERNSTGSDKPQTGDRRGNNKPGRNTFYVWYFYVIHLLVRSILGILFTILQHAKLYPSGFDLQFSCVYPELNVTGSQNESVALSNVTCNNSTAPDKQFWGTIVAVCNVIFAVIGLAEVIYLILHPFPYFISHSHRAWSCDSEFVVYFLGKRYVCDQNELTAVGSSLGIYKQNVLKVSLTQGIKYGPNTSLDNMFIDVIIQTKQAPHKFPKGMNRHEMYDVYMDVPENSIHLEEIKDLFYPNKDTNYNFLRTILVLGRPGIGKTVLTRKIMRDWANKDTVDDFYCGKIAFYFKFSMFNFDQLQNISLKKFLQFGTTFIEGEEDKFESIFEEIWETPQNAILIFDGLDELGGSLEKFQIFLEQSKLFSNDPICTMSALRLFIKLLSGDMLKGATIVVTSRPITIDVYSKFNFERKVEVIGFTSAKIEKYVEEFCANYNNAEADLKPKVWSYITSSSEVKNLCYIPMNCFIVCGTLVDCLSDPTNDSSLPTTLTELYQAALLYIVMHDRKKSKEYYDKVIKELQELAFSGMKNNQLIFSCEFVNKQMKESGLLHCLPSNSGLLHQIQTQVCFIHLTVQEFLAARHIVETKEPEDIKEFITSHIKVCKWHLVLQFLAGLLRRKMKTSDMYRGCVLAFTEHLGGKIEDEHVVCYLDSSQVLGMKCVREVDDEVIAKEAAVTSALKDVTRIQAVIKYHTPSDWAAVVFVCKYLNTLPDLYLSRIMNRDCFLELTKLLQERCLKSLCLCGPNGGLYLEDVVAALLQLNCQVKHEHSKLTELVLDRCEITNFGVSQLSKFLINDHGSSLRKLMLVENRHIARPYGEYDKTVSRLCDVLGSELFELQLTMIYLGCSFESYKSVSTLCKALRKHFKLKELHLVRCSLSTNNSDDNLIYLFEEFLSSSENCTELTELSLSFNRVCDVGVRNLCNSLRLGKRNLTYLDLSGCSLTHECVSTLCEALGELQELSKLTTLKLAHNKIGDKGVCMLWHALSKAQHNLANLDLSGCYLTEKCLSFLGNVFGDGHCDLTILKLSFNDNIGDEGVRMLCDVLRKEQLCNLTVLNLSCCSLTDECMPFLCEALGDERCRLTELNLSFNYFTDKHVLLLSHVLKLEHCCHKVLVVGKNNITEVGRRCLHDAMGSEYHNAGGLISRT